MVSFMGGILLLLSVLAD